MTGAHVEKLRAFVALDLEPAARATFAAQMDALRKHSNDSWRWVGPGMMHMTLAFLGDIPVASVAPMSSALAALSAVEAAPAPRMATLTAFPGAGRARILVLALADEDGACARLAASVAKALTPHGYVPEARAYRPHVTLARTRAPFDARPLVRQTPPIVLDGAAWGEMTFYQSHLSPSHTAGSERYTVLARFTLAEPISASPPPAR